MYESNQRRGIKVVQDDNEDPNSGESSYGSYDDQDYQYDDYDYENSIMENLQRSTFES